MKPGALEPELLLKFRIPEVREDWTLADTVFYNLSIGIGADPCSMSELKYLRHSGDVRTLPSMATVMAHPGFWLEDPQSGVDPHCALHGEQTVEFDGPLPACGSIVSQSRIGNLIDKGEGRDAILETITELVDAKTDSRIASLRRTTVLRKCGGFGGMTTSSAGVQPRPDGPPDRVVDRATLPQQALIYALNGDSNALHVDPVTARDAGFPGPILHGLCTFGVINFLIEETLFPERNGGAGSIALRFSSPVFPGETIRTSIWNEGHFEASVVERDQTIVRNGICRTA